MLKRRVQVNSSRITYISPPDATPESELNALATAYKFIIDCHAKKEAAGPRQADDLEDAMKGSNDDRARHILPEQP